MSSLCMTKGDRSDAPCLQVKMLRGLLSSHLESEAQGSIRQVSVQIFLAISNWMWDANTVPQWKEHVPGF